MGKFFLIKNCKAQAWSLDLTVACVIFLISLIILYVYAINYKGGASENLNNLFYEGNTIAEILLSSDDLGIVSQNIVNQTKLDSFYYSNYSDKRKSFGIMDDFYFFIDGMTINSTSISYIGRLNQSSLDSVVKITRFTIYKNKPVKLEVYIWR